MCSFIPIFIRLSPIFLIGVLLVSGCSNSNDPNSEGTQPLADNGVVGMGSDDQMSEETNGSVAKFSGTWIACREDSTAESTRLTFVFDGVSGALFLEETIFEIGCFNEPSNSNLRVGELLFDSPIIDTALGFTAYPITFVDSDTEQANTKNLIYTDTNLLYFGITSSTNESPTALDTWVVYNYAGPPNFALVDR